MYVCMYDASFLASHQELFADFISLSQPISSHYYLVITLNSNSFTSSKSYILFLTYYSPNVRTLFASQNSWFLYSSKRTYIITT